MHFIQGLDVIVSHVIFHVSTLLEKPSTAKGENQIHTFFSWLFNFSYSCPLLLPLSFLTLSFLFLYPFLLPPHSLGLVGRT